MNMHSKEANAVEIFWDDTIDEYMTIAKSPDHVLEEFFSINDWQFIKNIYQDVIDESDVEYLDKSIEFYKNRVTLVCDGESSDLDKDEFFKLMAFLFDMMIVGANDDHHGVRYEPWWQPYTEVSYRLQHKVQLELI